MTARIRTVSRLLGLLACCSVTMASSEELTPLGAPIAGEAPWIPAWSGGITTPPGDYGGAGETHPDPFGDDEPIARLTATDTGDFGELLPAGLRALLDTYADTARIDVYPSRRSHSAPAFVYENTERNGVTAALVDGGNGFEGASAGIPFPAPENALEIYWNHVARWRGQAVEARSADLIVYPNGRVSRTVRETLARFDYYLPAAEEPQTNRLFSLLSRTVGSGRNSGSAALVHETINQEAEARSSWAWDAGRRRVLRAPLLAFDQPLNTMDGLMTADDVDLINGSPARFDWEIVGRKAMVVPYNNYRLAAYDRDELALPGHLAPDALRYEVHRVWIIEGRLREEWRHPYHRRVLYVDADSWTALVAESYDADGSLWRVGVNYPKNYYEVPATLPVAYVFHDLKARRYAVQGLASSPAAAPIHTTEIPSAGRFNPSGLRRFAR
ncbi:MAG: DUF1329 domain-containing protein [Pseudomonadota bacterium]